MNLYKTSGEEKKILSDGQDKLFMAYAVVEICVFSMILLLAIFNLFHYIRRMQNNKFFQRAYCFRLGTSCYIWHDPVTGATC